MTEFETVEVEKREGLGKGANRRLRAAGRIPGILYGGDREPVPIQVDQHKLLELLRTGGDHRVVLLKLAGAGKARHAMIRDLMVDPITRKVLHVDLQRVVMTEKLRVDVPIEVVGTPIGVKSEDGVLDFVTRRVEIECLPGNIPDKLPVDVSELHVNQHISARDLPLPEGVELLEEPDRVIVAVSYSEIEEEVAAEAEAAEELLAEEPEEPEVIRRGKVTEEEEAAEEPEEGEAKEEG